MLITQWTHRLNYIFANIGVRDFVDILLIWILVYRLLVLVRRTGSTQILSGLGILGIAYTLSIWLELLTFNWVLQKIFSNLFVIVVVLFQGEIRRALAQIGASPFGVDSRTLQDTENIEALLRGVVGLLQKGHGALIVLEKDLIVDYYIEVGTELDCVLSPEVLESIFLPTSPIHDGAVLIRKGRIHSAGCFLPLSRNNQLDKNLGTRHRAALGLTEETDALVLVLSEESKSVGVVQGGQLQSHLSLGEVRQRLSNFFEESFHGA